MHWDWYHAFCPSCTRPLLPRRARGWYDLCCEPNCIHSSIPGIGTPAGPSCPCDANFADPCGMDCLCDHCAWSFGFRGKVFSDLQCIDWGATISQSCQNYASKIREGMKYACWGAAQCACMVDRDSAEQTHFDDQFSPGWFHGRHHSGWQDAWECIARICRGELKIRFECHESKSGANYHTNCDPAIAGETNYGFVYEPTQHENTIHLCVQNIDFCWGTVILHELLHICGLNTSGNEGDANDHFAATCVDPATCLYNGPLYSSSGCKFKVMGPCF